MSVRLGNITIFLKSNISKIETDAGIMWLIPINKSNIWLSDEDYMIHRLSGVIFDIEGGLHNSVFTGVDTRKIVSSA